MLLFYNIFILSLKESSNHCENCKNRISLVLNKMDKAKFDEKKIDEYCSKFSSKSSKCHKFTSHIFSMLKKDMIQSDADEICSSMGSCRPKPFPLSKRASIPAAKLQEDQNSCEYCKNLFDHLTDDALEEFTVPIVFKFVKEVCVSLPPVQAFCDSVTAHHVEKFIMLITSKFENSEICESAGLC